MNAFTFLRLAPAINLWQRTQQAGRTALAILWMLAGLLGGLTGWSSVATASTAQQMEQAAKGQTVYFNAWGGSPILTAILAGWQNR